MISINFTGNTLDDLAKEAGYFVARYYAGIPQVITSDVAAVDPLPLAGEPPIETGAAKAANEAIKRTRRTKAEMEAARAAEARGDMQQAAVHAVRAYTEDPITAAAISTAAAPAPATEPPTMLDVKAAAMRVVERDGLGQEAAFAIVKSFGVTRISALEENQFVAFVDACNAKLAG